MVEQRTIFRNLKFHYYLKIKYSNSKQKISWGEKLFYFPTLSPFCNIIAFIKYKFPILITLFTMNMSLHPYKDKNLPNEQFRKSKSASFHLSNQQLWWGEAKLEEWDFNKDTIYFFHFLKQNLFSLLDFVNEKSNIPYIHCG